MSVICQKEYTVKIAPTFFAYYNCDDLAAPLVDQVSARNLLDLGGVFTSAPGKINTAIDIDVNGYQAANSTDWDFSGHDFTVRLWLNTGNDSTYDFLFISVLGQWFLYYNGGFPGSWEFKVTLNDQSQVSDYVNAALTSGWHRVIVYVQNAVKIGIKIDNNAAVEQAIGLPLLPHTDPFSPNPFQGLKLTRQFNGIPCLIDEIAVWKDKVLTPAEMLYDWNGGAGRTYPDL